MVYLGPVTGDYNVNNIMAMDTDTRRLPGNLLLHRMCSSVARVTKKPIDKCRRERAGAISYVAVLIKCGPTYQTCIESNPIITVNTILHTTSTWFWNNQAAAYVEVATDIQLMLSRRERGGVIGKHMNRSQ